jgi:ABC-type Fe3+-hydroxamate transport system substrate-binding protein
MSGVELTDDRGRLLKISRPPRRIVSLVPSDTYTLVALGAGERLVGRTKFCVEPDEALARVPEVGGTKDPDLEKVIALEPDLVVMNREENNRVHAEELERRGVKVLATMPRTLAEGAAQMARLGRVLGDLSAAAKDRVRAGYQAMKAAEARREAVVRSGKGVRTFVAIWWEPLMTANARTFLSDALEHAGALNMFADRERKYPLAADMGRAEPLSIEKVGDRDVRYPRVTMDEVIGMGVELVVLPDEPYTFSEKEAALFRERGAPRVVLSEGRGMMWPGLKSLESAEALAKLIGG